MYAAVWGQWQIRVNPTSPCLRTKLTSGWLVVGMARACTPVDRLTSPVEIRQGKLVCGFNEVLGVIFRQERRRARQ